MTAKKLSPETVARMDKGRAAAEAAQGKRGPGRPRKDGSPAQARPKTVEEATKRIEGERPAPAPAEPERVFRMPTNAEIAMIRRFLDVSNKPLLELEASMEGYGIVGPESPPAPVKKGQIPLSKDELEMGAECTAGTIVNFAPNFLLYLYPLGLITWGLSVIGSRAVIFWRLKQLQAKLEAEQRQAEEEAKRKSKLSPSAAPAAPNAAPRGELVPMGKG